MKSLAWGCAGLGILTGIGLLLAPLLVTSSCRVRNDRNAAATIKTLHSAEIDFRDNDRDGDGRRQFWRADVAGLYALLPKGSDEMIKLIEISAAGADLHPVGTARLGEAGPGVVGQDQYAASCPKAGYWYAALRFEDEVDGRLHTDRFVFCAVPDTPSAGRVLFAVTHEGVVWEAPVRGARDVPRAFPLDPERSGWKRWAQ
jgi:hypothetical protein